MGSAHVPPEPSLPVGVIAAHSGAWLRVLERHGVEFGCGGARSLQQACEECGADAAEVVGDLKAASVEFLTQSADWNHAPLGDLVSYIRDVHHAAVRQELPELIRQSCAVHGDAGRPGSLYASLQSLREELEPHLEWEEELVFPAIQRLLATGEVPAPQQGGFRTWTEAMERDHQKFCRDLRQIPVAAASAAARNGPWLQMEPQLARFSRNFRIHLHMEGNILMPRVLQHKAVGEDRLGG